MRKINLDKVKTEDLIELDDLKTAYREYLKKELGYTDSETSFVANDLDDLYEIPYILQSYEMVREIDGIEYIIRSCKTDFSVCRSPRLDNKKPFKFYMFINVASLENETVGAYKAAEKKYIV